ncbi:glutathione S-transferase [Stella humosa]|uniref:Glutathione S-transferase n=1 Tax=Stella humosa TaxID=94 RepID=A0A3N1MEF8_9PROT|nr:glutathione S-transferase family protein [Stella humosa]ROQ01110.1 glutathione S-transferase [Stella humosa]BBK31482.1 glutathione S-transferase [Stella humosa]
MLRILGRKTSSNVQKVLWLCTELDLPYAREDIGGPYGRNKDPEYLALNPNGLVPTVDDDGFVLWESHAIMRYLAAKHGAEALWPADLKARADIDRWMDWGATVAGPAITPMFLQIVRTPKPDQDPKVIAASQQKTAEALTLLDQHLAGRKYIAGDSFTLADIPTGIQAFRWFWFPIERPDLPNVKAWYERLGERAGYRQHVMNPLV